MSLADFVRLRSVTFKAECAVRLPGTSSSGHYIPASDYPLRYYPELHLVEARCKDGTQSMPGEDRRRWYHASNTKDMSVDETSLPPDTQLSTTSSGSVTAPAPKMRMTPGGGFERVTEEEAAPVEVLPILKSHSGDPRAEEQPKKGGWPKGKPRGSKGAPPAAAAPVPPQQPPAIVPFVPQVRVRAERGD